VNSDTALAVAGCHGIGWPDAAVLIAILLVIGLVIGGALIAVVRTFR
jgi:hypothetical protein